MQDRDQTGSPPFSKAVALEEQADRGPVIVAKGSGHSAEKILEIAFAEGIKVRQDQSLVELLEAFEVESPIPLEALHAVSLILERVYLEEQRLASHQGTGDRGLPGEMAEGEDTQ